MLALGLILTGFLGGISAPVFVAPAGLDVAMIGTDGNIALTISLGLIVVTCAITIVQRIVHVQRQATHR